METMAIGGGPTACGASTAKEGAVHLRIAELEAALSAVVHHWVEFGPADGFDEVMDRTIKVLSGGK